MLTCSDKQSVSVLVSKQDGTDKIEFIPELKTDTKDDEYNRIIQFLRGDMDRFETPIGLFKRCER